MNAGSTLAERRLVAIMTCDADALVKGYLAQDIDEWTKSVVRRHFDPESGSPYWLRRAAGLSFDPRDITRYGELTAFGPFPLAELRTLDPAGLLPLAAPRPLAGQVWESGGTTGDPCRVVYTPPMLEHRFAWRRWGMAREGFEPGRSWLHATPTGPHLVGYGASDLAQNYGARVYSVDFDPRWVKRKLRAGQLQEATDYTDHLVQQLTGIAGSQPIDYLVATPALLRALVRGEPGLVARLRGAWLSGTHISASMWREFSAALSNGILAVIYGNSFGNTIALPVEPDGSVIPYLPNYPQITMSVVRQDDWTAQVGYGEYGQVRLSVLYEDLFLPNILERDLAMRFAAGDEWPCDGVANVRPLRGATGVTEGLY